MHWREVTAARSRMCPPDRQTCEGVGLEWANLGNINAVIRNDVALARLHRTQDGAAVVTELTLADALGLGRHAANVARRSTLMPGVDKGDP